MAAEAEKGQGEEVIARTDEVTLGRVGASDQEIIEVAEKFVLANCYDPKVVMQWFNDSGVPG